ncbi:MAG: twin-arginine translocation signal domain-containing protein [Verrucomicrobia bacterium]|nr:twin-arginine translocation signal domain-containing protein [Verrucomicrobiota bacterium]
MINRRHFLRTAGGATALAALSTRTPAAEEPVTGPVSGQPGRFAAVTVDGERLRIETHTLSAEMTKGALTSLRSRSTGEELIRVPGQPGGAALELIYRGDEIVRVDESKFGGITTHPLSPHRAEIVFHSWDGDGVVVVGADPESGDILIEPSACSSRPGVRGCRWNLFGLRPDLELVAPFFQGIKLKLDDALIRNTHWAWPFFWEAGLAILQGPGGGFWVRTQDDRYRYKAIQVGSSADPHRLGFDTEAYGPIDQNLGAGGLVWRLNVFQGDWTVPAGQYRDWLWQAYDLQRDEAARPSWIHDVRFAVSWCPGAPEILEALARRLDPKRVLIHYPNWRTDPYDENYPAYVASDAGKEFVAKGHAMGFRMMPHFNAIDMDPSHPAYAYLRDFQYRGIDRQDLRGWSWHQGRGLGVPESNASRDRNRDKKVMVKIHPGLGLWRSILGRNILEAARDLSLETVFIDVTLVSHNLHNSLVDGMTSTEGMNRLIRHVAGLGSGLVVGGEGLNEITMQGQSFAQAHLFKSWQQSIDGLERTGGCDLNHRLFGRLCRTIGYSGLGGRDDGEALRMRMHVEHGAIPTVTIRSAADLDNPNPAVRRMLELAG